MIKKKINIKVIPNSKKNNIEINNECFKIHLTAQPIEGKANSALIKYLSKELDIKKKDITIIKGKKSRNKTVEIMTDNHSDKLLKLFKGTNNVNS